MIGMHVRVDRMGDAHTLRLRERDVLVDVLLVGIDDGELFPTSFAVIELTPAAEQRLVELVKKAVA